MQEKKPMTFRCAVKRGSRKECGKKFATFWQLLQHLADWRSGHYNHAPLRVSVADMAQRAREAGL